MTAGVATHGVIRWSSMPSGLPPDAVTVGLEPPALAAPDAESWLRLLGAGAPEKTPAASLRLVGIAADRTRSQWGFALISENGQAAKPYRIGDTLPDGRRLARLEGDTAILEAAHSGSTTTLALVRKDEQRQSR